MISASVVKGLISVEYLHFDVQVTGLNTHTAPTMHLENGHKSSHGGFGNSLRISVFAIKVFASTTSFIGSTSF